MRRAGKTGRRLMSACPLTQSDPWRFWCPRLPPHLRVASSSDASRSANAPSSPTPSGRRLSAGALLLIAAVAGLVIANSAWRDAYENLKDFVIGPAALHLDLSLETWAADGLLAIFFFVAGLELKRELVVGTLRERSQAVLPVVAAVCGMVVPALVFLAIAAGDPAARAGWAIPMATDIAFALAVLAVVGSHLPPALRAFLLTLAVVDDLGAITVIALFFTDYLRLLPLLIASALLVGYYLLQRRRVTTRWIYIPLALVIWTLVHDSGIHATVAGVAMGLLTRVKPDADEDHSPAERLEHRVRPLSAGIAVPIFAFLSAGVYMDIGDLDNWSKEPLLYAIMGGLVIGKLVGVFGGAYLTARFTRAELDPSLNWWTWWASAWSPASASPSAC